jgi:phage major head subunit gpT-like protein
MAALDGGFPKLVDVSNAIATVFDVANVSMAEYANIEALFNVGTSSRSSEIDMGMGDVNVSQWDMYENSRQKAQMTFAEWYKTTYTFPEYSVQYLIERKLLDDDQFGVVRDRVMKITESASRKRFLDAVSVFNNAFTAGDYAGSDAKALCATDHPTSPTNSTALSNRLSLALDAENLNTAMITMQQFKGDTGDYTTNNPDTLLVPLALRKKALELTQSQLDPETANNAINIYRGQMTVLVSKDLTDTNAWFLMDSRERQRSLKWFNRVPLEMKIVDETTTHIVYEWYMRYGYGFNNWRWIVGSNPS